MRNIWKTTLVFSILFGSCLNTGETAEKSPRKIAKSTRTTSPAKSHPLIPALKLAKSSMQTLASVKDFDATFEKKELVNGKIHPHMMYIKCRKKPFSVYLRFHKPHEGREVIYFEGKNDGKLLAHEAGIKGIVGTVSLSPDSRKALSEGRYPITKIGMHHMLQTLIAQWENETKYGEVKINYYPNAKLLNKNPRLRNMECKVIETSHPVPRKQFPYHITRLYIDKKTNLPVRVEQHGFPPRQGAPLPLIAEYTYWNVRTNPGFQDSDFDKKNAQYDF